MRKPTQAQIDKAAKKILDAAQKYGDKAALEDYSDDEEGVLLECAYNYAELRRRAATKLSK